MMKLATAAAAFAIAFGLASPLRADPVEDFFKNKTVTVMIG